MTCEDCGQSYDPAGAGLILHQETCPSRCRCLEAMQTYGLPQEPCAACRREMERIAKGGLPNG